MFKNYNKTQLMRTVDLQTKNEKNENKTDVYYSNLNCFYGPLSIIKIKK